MIAVGFGRHGGISASDLPCRLFHPALINMGLYSMSTHHLEDWRAWSIKFNKHTEFWRGREARDDFRTRSDVGTGRGAFGNIEGEAIWETGRGSTPAGGRRAQDERSKDSRDKACFLRQPDAAWKWLCAEYLLDNKHCANYFNIELSFTRVLQWRHCYSYLASEDTEDRSRVVWKTSPPISHTWRDIVKYLLPKISSSQID